MQQLAIGKLYKVKNPIQNRTSQENTTFMILGTGIIYATIRNVEPTALAQMVDVKTLTNDIGVVMSDVYTYIAITGATACYVKGTEFEEIGDIS